MSFHHGWEWADNRQTMTHAQAMGWLWAVGLGALLLGLATS